MILLHTLITLLIVLSFNKIYFFYSKKIIFFKYFIKFNVYTFVIILLFSTYKKYFFINNEYRIIFSALIINYYLFFLSFLLTIGLKSMNSPSYDIYNIIKNNKTTLDILIYKMRKKKIINKRKKDLINQGLIKKKNLELTILGIIVARFFFLVKKVYNLKLEG